MSPAPRHHDPIFLGLMRVGGFIEPSRRSTGKALIGLLLLWQMLTAWIPS